MLPEFWLAIGLLLLLGIVEVISDNIVAGGWSVLAISSVFLGWLVYTNLIEWSMFSRRSMALSGFENTGWSYRIFVRGTFKKAMTLLISIVFCAAFLLHVSQAPVYHWYAMYMDALLIPLLLYVTRSQLVRECKPMFRNLIQRRYVFFLNAFLVGAIIAVVGLFTPMDDFRSENPLRIIHSIWNEQDQIAATDDVVVEIGLKTISSFDALGIFLMQKASVQDFAQITKLIGWVIFFIIQSFYIWVLQSAMLGAINHREKHGSWMSWLLGRSMNEKLGWGVFYVLVMLWIGLNISAEYPSSTSKLTVVESNQLKVDPCKRIREKESAIVSKELNNRLNLAHDEYNKIMKRNIDARFDADFLKAEKGVDSYLDWYYKWGSEWKRIGSAFLYKVGVMDKDPKVVIREKMVQHIIVNSGFKSAILKSQNSLRSLSDTALQKMRIDVVPFIESQAGQHKCAVNSSIPFNAQDLDRDVNRIILAGIAAGSSSVAATTGASSAAMAKGLAAATGKAVSKVAAKKLGAKATAKVLSGLSGSIEGGLLGLTCGPAAPVCSVALGIAGFIGMDIALLKGDEMLTRSKMRNQMIRQLRQHQLQIKQRLLKQYNDLGNLTFSKISEKSHKHFVPIRDGI